MASIHFPEGGHLIRLNCRINYMYNHAKLCILRKGAYFRAKWGLLIYYIFRNMRSFENLGYHSDIPHFKLGYIQLQDAFRPIAREQKYLMDCNSTCQIIIILFPMSDIISDCHERLSSLGLDNLCSKIWALRPPHTSRFFVLELQFFCRGQIGLKFVWTSVCRTLADFFVATNRV